MTKCKAVMYTYVFICADWASVETWRADKPEVRGIRRWQHLHITQKKKKHFQLSYKLGNKMVYLRTKISFWIQQSIINRNQYAHVNGGFQNQNLIKKKPSTWRSQPLLKNWNGCWNFTWCSFYLCELFSPDSTGLTLLTWLYWSNSSHLTLLV